MKKLDGGWGTEGTGPVGCRCMERKKIDHPVLTKPLGACEPTGMEAEKAER